MDDVLFPTHLASTVAIGASLCGALLAAVMPTCLYAYVEPRSRMGWGVSGDTPQTRRAPRSVRVAAWLSFALAQLAVPALLVVTACVALLYVQIQLGVLRPATAAAFAGLGVAAAVQAFFALRLLPIGVRLLARDARLGQRVGAVARSQALVSAGIASAAGALGWGLPSVPGWVHPWMRVLIDWAAVRPLVAGAGLCLVHALLLAFCARALVSTANPNR